MGEEQHSREWYRQHGYHWYNDRWYSAEEWQGMRGNVQGNEGQHSSEWYQRIKDMTGVDLPPPERKTIDLEGRIVKDGVRKVIRDRQQALADLVHAITEYRKLAEGTPLTLQGESYAHAVLELNKAIERADRLLL